MHNSTTQKADVTIIGGGLTGMTMACSLAQHDINVVVIESAEPKIIKKISFDGRVSAIAYGSQQLFERIGIWNGIREDAGPIYDIRVSDRESHLFLHYKNTLVTDGPVGYMVPNATLMNALYKKAESLPNLTLIAPAKYDAIECNNTQAKVFLGNGKTISCELLIAADGKHSTVRKTAGIDTLDWSYDQTGIVCTIKHEKNHRGVAQERFLPAGPFAVLPVKGGYHSSLVWTEKKEQADLYMQMDDSAFLEEIAVRIGGYLGKLSLASKRFSYPLTLVHAKTYLSDRLVLVGDAAHGIHPLAGQGFNLGIRDVDFLTETLLRARKLGLDIGSHSSLHEYEKLRKFDANTLIAITHGLNYLFSSDQAAFIYTRRLGMAVVNKIFPLKRMLMRHAMGIHSGSDF